MVAESGGCLPIGDVIFFCVVDDDGELRPYLKSKDELITITDDIFSALMEEAQLLWKTTFYNKEI